MSLSTLQGWRSDADDQDDQDDDDFISYLTCVGLDSDLEPSKNCNVQANTTSTMRQAPIGRASEVETFSLRPATSSASLHPRR